MMIELKKIKSQGLKEAGYDESTQDLFVRFPNDSIYKYLNVPKKLWEEFSATFQTDVSSNGFFMEHIRAKFEFERVAEKAEAENKNAPTQKASTAEQIERDLKDLDNLFKYHAPTPNQVERFGLINEAAKNLARTIILCCPPSADRSAAIRQVREARMTANASIACNE